MAIEIGVYYCTVCDKFYVLYYCYECQDYYTIDLIECNCDKCKDYNNLNIV